VKAIIRNFLLVGLALLEVEYLNAGMLGLAAVAGIELPDAAFREGSAC
jgi:hypothetical protein